MGRSLQIPDLDSTHFAIQKLLKQHKMNDYATTPIQDIIVNDNMIRILHFWRKLFRLKRQHSLENQLTFAYYQLRIHRYINSYLTQVQNFQRV